VPENAPTPYYEDGPFLTPESIPEETACRLFSIPNEQRTLGAFMGALDSLLSEGSWLQLQDTDVDPATMVALFTGIISDAYQIPANQCDIMAQTPYWDDQTDVEAEEPIEMQPWYGYVTDILAPPDGITWNENISLWLFTGLVALAASPAAAIVFRPLAVQFTLAFKAGDVGETIRIILDAIEQRPVDTTGHAGEIINVACSGDPSLSEHTLYVIKTS